MLSSTGCCYKKLYVTGEYFCWGVLSVDETLCWMLDITNKMILEGEIKDAKMSSFSSDFQTLIKH